MKMANSQTNEFEEYVKCLLKCPACSEPIKSSPIHQCTNGHVVCKDCITKLEYCPICKNDSTLEWYKALSNLKLAMKYHLIIP